MTYLKHKEKKIDAVIQPLQYFFFKRLFNNNQLLQIPHLQFVRSKLLPTKQFCSLWKKCHNIKTERFKRHHQLQSVLWCDHTVSSDGCSSTQENVTKCQRAATEAAGVRGKRCSLIFVFHHSNLSESMSGTVAVYRPSLLNVSVTEFWWVGPGPSATRLSYTTIKNHVCFLDSCVSSALTKTPENIKTASVSLLATKARLQEQTHRHLSHLVKWNQLIIIR